MPPKKTKTTPKAPPHWALQGAKRPKGRYYQAIWGKGSKRRLVTLGYLSSPEAATALRRLQVRGDELVQLRLPGGELVTPDDDRASQGVPVYDDEQIRACTRGELPKVKGKKGAKGAKASIPTFQVEEPGGESAASKTRRFDPARLSLSTYWETVYWPVRQREVCAGTVRRELWYWTQRVLPALGKVLLRDVSGHLLDRFLSSHSEWSGSARRICLNAVRCLLKYAAETGVIGEVKTRPVKGSTLRVRSRPVALSSSEVLALLAEAPSPAHRALWAYAVGQGLRPAEASTLRWDDVDWARGRLRVRGTKNVLADRVVPLTPATRGELEPYWRGLGCPQAGHAFLWRRRPIVEWGNALSAAAARAGLDQDGRRIFPYLLRHTFATGACLAGVPKTAVKELLGHSSASEMLDLIYSNPSLGQLQESVSRLTRLGG